MATYNEIQSWVKAKHGWIPKTCWIAHCKEIVGLPVSNAPNRKSDSRMVPCPAEKQEAILSAFQHFGMLDC